MPRNFKRTLVILLLPVDLESMKSKFLTETTCSNHVLKLEISVELVFLSILATVETCSHVVEEMVLSEFSMLSMMYDSLNRINFRDYYYDLSERFKLN